MRVTPETAYPALLPVGLAGMLVWVYYNLNKRTFSIMAREGPRKGRVIYHADVVFLRSVTLKVSARGRNRVLREKCRNVHAGAEGWLCEAVDIPQGPANVITYNPYLGDRFVDLTRECAPVEAMDYAQFINRRINAWGAR